MTDIQSFDVIDPDFRDEEDPVGLRCPRVAEFPDVTPEMIADSNPVVTNLERISITFDYPLSQPTTREFFNPGGFTCYDFFRAVYEGYAKIYAEEEQAVGNPGHIPGMLNRSVSQGPHGIWGHDMEDLFLEGFREATPGCFVLSMGS